MLSLLLLTLSARADSITLDTGAVVEGNLSRYEQGGACEVTITQPDLMGVVLTVPCYRVQSFVRTHSVLPRPPETTRPPEPARVPEPTHAPENSYAPEPALLSQAPASSPPPTAAPPAAYSAAPSTTYAAPPASYSAAPATPALPTYSAAPATPALPTYGAAPATPALPTYGAAPVASAPPAYAAPPVAPPVQSAPPAPSPTSSAPALPSAPPAAPAVADNPDVPMTIEPYPYENATPITTYTPPYGTATVPFGPTPYAGEMGTMEEPAVEGTASPKESQSRPVHF